ncbi:MAG: DJ-1 family glyoxalase III [Lachnospiraceae bacterium]
MEKHSVYLFLVSGFETVEAMTPLDLLRRANIDVKSVSLTDSYEVESSLGVTIKADLLFSMCDFTDAEALILPGGPGVPNLIASKALCDLVLAHYQAGKLTCAICAAPKVLAHIGINVPTTVYPSMIEEVPQYVDRSVVVSDHVITGEGLAASIEFSLEIIKALRGEEIAHTVANSIACR